MQRFSRNNNNQHVINVRESKNIVPVDEEYIPLEERLNSIIPESDEISTTRIMRVKTYTKKPAIGKPPRRTA